MTLDIDPGEKAPADEIRNRYVAGLSVKEDGSPTYSVFRLVETASGDRLATGSVIMDMDQEQLDHLRMQVGRVSTQDRTIREKVAAAKALVRDNSNWVDGTTALLVVGQLEQLLLEVEKQL